MEKVKHLELYKEKITERQDTKDELEAFATQELTKVKHMVSSLEYQAVSSVSFTDHQCTLLAGVGQNTVRTPE